jgi:NADP-dependent 3-hydroxy acid dehydrogenase YdfG
MTAPDGRKVIWITGAGKGIGRALAKHYALAGWIVAASARTEADLGTLAEEAPKGSIKPFSLDVTDKAATAEAVRRVELELGTVDLAIFNAGTHLPTSVDGFSVDEFRQLVETNLMGTVNGLDPIMNAFLARGSGHIAIVASLAGYRGLPGAAAYGATKAALINMCEALKPDLERSGVKLSLINPGFVETPLTAQNDFPMPFLIPVEEAVAHIVRGLERSDFEIAFPGRFAFLMKVLRVLPDRLFFALTRRMLRE